MSGSATFDGHVIASIKSRGNESVAAGNFRTEVNFASGVGNFAASPGDVRTYKISDGLQDTNSAQGKDASAKFTWEAQST